MVWRQVVNLHMNHLRVRRIQRGAVRPGAASSGTHAPIAFRLSEAFELWSKLWMEPTRHMARMLFIVSTDSHRYVAFWTVFRSGTVSL